MTTANLSEVNCNGTVAKWNALATKPSWNGCSALHAITCTDGAIEVNH